MTYKNQLTLSIVTVVFNEKENIKRCIQSVISQNCKSTKHIIIDGGSTDGTVDVIKQFGKKIAYWVSEKDMGIYDAMNKGIKVSDSDYIFFLGADDHLLPDSINKLFEYLNFQKTEALLALPVELSIKSKNFIPDIELPVPLVHHQGAIFNLEALKKISLYSEKYKIHSDFDLMVRYSQKYSVKYVPVPICKFYKGGKSSSGEEGLTSAKEQLSIYLKYKGSIFNKKNLILTLTPLYYWIQFLIKIFLTQKKV